MKFVTAEQLHDWYLEAIQTLPADAFNPAARKPYKELNEHQKYIDEYIAAKVNQLMADNRYTSKARKLEGLWFILF